MNKLIYFFVLVLFLLLIKIIVFNRESFHPLDDGASDRRAAQERADQEAARQRQTEEAAQEAAIERERQALLAARTAYETALSAAENASEDQQSRLIEVAQNALESLNEIENELNIDTTEFDDPRITTPQSLPARGPLSPAEEQRRRVGGDHNVRNQTIQSLGDNMCCGVNIYEIKLENIGKCVSQHIAQTGELEDPKFIEWKDEETECRNPHRILSRTSNCSDIVHKYNPSIKTLLDIIKDTSCEKCDYLRYLQDLSSLQNDELTDNQKLLIFQKRIACELRGKNEIGNDKLIINETEFEINECGEPNGSLRVGGCD